MSDSSNSTDMVAQVKGELPIRIGDPVEAARAIQERILAAPDVESLFKMAGTLGADDVLERPFWLRGVEFRKSDFEEGTPVYAIITAQFTDDESEGVITCGGMNVCTQLAKAEQFGGVPFPIMLVRTAKPTSNGYYPLWLTTPDVTRA